MPRDARAYLADILESLSRRPRDIRCDYGRAPKYRSVDDALVWAIAKRDAPVLFRECTALLQRIETTRPAD